MHIVHLAAGAGEMYCGACNRDMALLRGLMDRGHDVLVIPLYTPLRIEGERVQTSSIFLGGINAYLQQHLNFFHHTPRFLDRILDHPGLLRWAASMAVKTSPADLGPMTVSVLQGCDGRQSKELFRLIDYLDGSDVPRLFSITNSLLIGIAPELKSKFDAPVICGLQGEEAFICRMPEEYARQARQLIQKHARHVDLFTAGAADYADEMSEYLEIDRSRIHVVRTGFDVRPYREIAESRDQAPGQESGPIIGYLSVITPIKGLDVLVKAWRRLAGDHPDLRLHVAGKVLDRKYYTAVDQMIARAGLRDRFQHFGEVDMEGKLQFLSDCTLFCLPARGVERRGLAALEAIASGIPVVVPDTGVFPEMIERTDGGCLFEPEDSDALTDKIGYLLNNRFRMRAMGRKASRSVAEYYRAEAATDDMLEAIEKVTGGG